jgi:hypothetical protein
MINEHSVAGPSVISRPAVQYIDSDHLIKQVCLLKPGPSELNQLVETFGLTLDPDSPALTNITARKLTEDSEYKQLVTEYFKNSNPHNTVIEMVNVWEVQDSSRYTKFIDNGYELVDNWLLWHGTKRKNLISILEDSLRTHR